MPEFPPIANVLRARGYCLLRGCVVQTGVLRTVAEVNPREAKPGPCTAPGCPGCPSLLPAVEQRLAAYAAPTALSNEHWRKVRVRVLCLVRRTAPGSETTARLRLERV